MKALPSEAISRQKFRISSFVQDANAQLFRTPLVTLSVSKCQAIAGKWNWTSQVMQQGTVHQG
jgi:hypothetical protein